MDAVHRIAWLVALLMAVAAAAGLLVPSVYRDNLLVSAGWAGNDLVTLVVGCAGALVALLRRYSAKMANSSRTWPVSTNSSTR